MRLDENQHSLDFLKENKLGGLYPISVKNNLLVLPDKYLEVLTSLDSETNFENMKATDTNWNYVRELLVSGYWLDNWYDDNLPTPKTLFFDLDQTNITFDTGKFLRLTSVSSKTQTAPEFSLKNVDQIINTERCLDSLALAKRVGREIKVAVRDWIDTTCGVEWRCFVYDDKVRAIAINDTAIADQNNTEIITRVQELYKKIRYNVPSIDCVMDVWLHNSDAEKDCVIEFNSYGFWGNACIDLYDWVLDGAILYGLVDEISIRR